MSRKKKRSAEAAAGDPPSPPSGSPQVQGAAGARSLTTGRLVFAAVVLLCAALDVGSKYAAFGALDARIEDSGGTPVTRSEKVISVVGETLRFHAAINTGAVFGIMRGRWLMLVVFAFIALGIIGWVVYKSTNSGLPLLIGLGLVCAGAMGNLWDRFLYGGVRDFILFTSPLLEPFFPGGHWPTFNLADAWIVAGIPLIAIGDWIRAGREAKEAEAGKAGGAKA